MMSVDSILNQNYVKWMDQTENGEDIVISSRIRLARNLHELPFPHLLDEEKGAEVLQLIQQVWEKDADHLKQVDFASLQGLSIMDRQILMEKHLISPEFSHSNSAYRGVLLNEEGSTCIMINEEDHIRIQCVLPGLSLDQCCQQAMALDDAFEAELDYAFDEKRGYLTACPTNVGTGLRASVMLHLPAIQFTGQAR
ncbi:MAG TPA: ATP--guanido phosphotransferase, partial [Syntrophomonadaceae bacterium]|nr:ATP--guanido phosphotransferase [Syntrophomonadaceae bacterium]